MNIKNKEGFRKCTRCKIEKELTSEYFYKQKARPQGFDYTCKECDKKRTKKVKPRAEWSEERVAKRKQSLAKYARSEKGKSISIFKAYEKFDLDRGYETSITKEFLLSLRKQSCIYCGFPATGVDRIDNKKGHTIENTVACCKECNVARMDNFTHEETFLLGKTIREIKLNRDKNVNI
jgi:hypothetical protein